MADDFHFINLLATDGATVTIDDQLPGIDWLVLEGEYQFQSDIRLSWENANGVSVSASGMYFVSGASGGFVGSRLIVNGFIENARGSDTRDFIQGNEGGNILMGDGARTGKGGNDVLWGLDGNDTIFGGNGADEIKGDNGDDRLFGDAGNDNISGGAGADYVEGGAGADEMYGGGDLGDTIAYRSSNAGVRILITFGSATLGAGGHAEGDLIGGFGNVDGSDFGDTMTDTVAGSVAFGGNDNIFRGFGGRDKLLLGGGNDIGYGGDDHDTIWGEAGDDTAYGGAGNDTLNMGDGNDLARGGAGNDILRGDDGNDRLFGDNGNDIIFTGKGRDRADGGAGDDQILASRGVSFGFGGNGDDKLISAGGRNTFTGGSGVDTFEFRTQAADLGSGGFTRITDFQRAKGEQIDLRIFGDLHFIRTDALSGTGLEVRFDTTANGVEIFADINGDGSADLKILVDGLAKVFAADFLLA